MCGLSYDMDADILYIGIADKRNSYGDESENDFVIFRDCATDEVTGITIMGLSKKLK